ncbi:GNAT family N-acetyltransferase [Aestuariivirga sp.]|uniref:GNAT family N-acetyltransferase n=1 Tax=Aestuariivirga sp. TaxID=2650926 RepID=UPI0025C0D4EB|nr:GNAT family N-acetyltransferase [Aestuariivirga sp.]MCA3554685.1 GNAT family N-acetyltransferase [Aestuariivirga sp.]
MTITIRPAVAGDGPVLIAMVRELAVHHSYEAYFTAAPEDYERFLADPHAINGAIIAEWNGVPAGCATWQRSYSTFSGREGIYLEDISVLPAFRRKGIATALLKAVAKLAVARKADAVKWLMMGWNTDARKLYEAAGACIEDGNCFCKLSEEALERLAS